MRIIVIDSTGVADEGPGSPAYFSRHTIDHLRAQGHTVEVHPGLDTQACSTADIVWTEWCNEDAFAAVISGACKRLVLRMRGYDLWAPLDRLQPSWDRINMLVYESPMLKALAEERFPFLADVKSTVLPSGVDLSRFTYRERGHGKTVALLARAVADKGYQLALEWARQHPDYDLHMTAALADDNHRLVRYLRETAPGNVTIHGVKDPATWLDEIDANYLLSASNWETLGYTIIEAMALGIKPLIHQFPGAHHNWPQHLLWEGFADLDALIDPASSYLSGDYRERIERDYDADTQARAFTKLLEDQDATEAKPVLVSTGDAANNPVTLIQTIHTNLSSGNVTAAEQAAALALQHPNVPPSTRSDISMQLAAAFYELENDLHARQWAFESMGQQPRTDALCLLGELCNSAGNLEGACAWYTAADRIPLTRHRWCLQPLVDERHARLGELTAAFERPHGGENPEPVPIYKIIVPVRNAEKWIYTCLESISMQSMKNREVIVIDDASDDGTLAEIKRYMAETDDDADITVHSNKERKWSLRNIAEAIIGPEGSQDDEAVIVIVDGDDWLASADALARVDEEYKRGAWMTYGSWRDTNGKLTWMEAYPREVVRAGAFRQHEWRGTHLKTFKQWLFRKVKTEDFQDERGEWLRITGDVALMLPMLEMACERAHFIEEPIYTYNVENPLNDHKGERAAEQMRVRDMLYSRPPRPQFHKK